MRCFLEAVASPYSTMVKKETEQIGGSTGKLIESSPAVAKVRFFLLLRMFHQARCISTTHRVGVGGALRRSRESCGPGWQRNPPLCTPDEAYCQGSRLRSLPDLQWHEPLESTWEHPKVPQ